MRDFELDLRAGGGGQARGSGGFYHLSFRSGSRGSGACAGSAHDYITREGEYAGPDRDAALYTESRHMPAWAAEDPRAYWDAADLYERANGRLYVSGDFALPRDLSAEDQVDLARDFVETLTDRERLLYTFAIHAGHDGTARSTTLRLRPDPERQNDGSSGAARMVLMREPRTSRAGGAEEPRLPWSKTGLRKHARRSRAPSTRSPGARSRRMRDHRSYVRQGADCESESTWPSAAHMVERGTSTTA